MFQAKRAMTVQKRGEGEGRQVSKKQRSKNDDLPSTLVHFCMTLPDYWTKK